jgi:hypothetical protein
MITIDELNVTVTVDGGGDTAEAAFTRLFNRYIERWWREVQSRARQDTRSAADRSVVGRTRERT